jgi:hypothetical protein
MYLDYSDFLRKEEVKNEVWEPLTKMFPTGGA